MLGLPRLLLPGPKDVERSIFKFLVDALRQQVKLLAGEDLVFSERVKVYFFWPWLHVSYSSLGLAI